MKLRFWKKPPDLTFSKNMRKDQPSFFSKHFHFLRSKKGAVVLIPLLTWVGFSAATAASISGVVTAAIAIVSIGYSIYSVIASYTSSQSKNASGSTTSSTDTMSSGHLLNTRACSEPVPIPYGDC